MALFRKSHIANAQSLEGRIRTHPRPEQKLKA
jgi:hypothetical protein